MVFCHVNCRVVLKTLLRINCFVGFCNYMLNVRIMNGMYFVAIKRAPIDRMQLVPYGLSHSYQR